MMFSRSISGSRFLNRNWRWFAQVAFLFGAGLLALLVAQAQYIISQVEESETIALLQANLNREFKSRGGFPAVDLDLRTTYYGRCATMRFRGDHGNYTLEEAIERLRQRLRLQLQREGDKNNRKSKSPSMEMHVGLEFLETPERFFPVKIRDSTPAFGTYHMFHFVELLVIAYAELHRVSTNMNSAFLNASSSSTSSFRQSALTVVVDWILSPHMAPSEIGGGPNKINFVISQLALALHLPAHAHAHAHADQRRFMFGLDAMERHEYGETREKAIPRRLELANQVYGYGGLSSSASSTAHPPALPATDAVLQVERFGCKDGGINKPWVAYVDAFPSQQWHEDISQGLSFMQADADNDKPKKDKHKQRNQFVACYIHRTRRTIPPEQESWLTEYLTQHDDVDFVLLKMEEYPALEQIQRASRCHAMLGAHGNGLTHAFFMPPGSYVVEMFWNFPFQFDYATTAQLMKHTYLGLVNGRALDRDQVKRRDPILMRNRKAITTVNANVNKAKAAFEDHGKAAIKEFVEQAIAEVLRNK